MQSLEQNRTELTPRKCRGSALLALLVSVAILLALFFVDFKSIFRPKPQLSKSGEVLPWFEEDRLVGPSKPIKLPTPPKPALGDQDFTITAKVTRQGQERGRIEMEFRPDGLIEGVWNAQFTQDKREAEFSANFNGNIDVTKTYQDLNGEQPGYLFFFTKGKYTETIYDRKTTRGSVNGGLIYVTGWIRPEGGMFGKLTITTDKKWHGEYDWDTTK